MVCIHGFSDTWRSWELVLPALERRHDVLALTLPGHAGGPPAPAPLDDVLLVEGVEDAMDDAGWVSAHIVGNSLGGFVALQVASRGRANTVTALAPAGGWSPGDETITATLEHFVTMKELLRSAAPHAEAIVASPEGRHRATKYTTVNFEHIPAELLAHQMLGVVGCDALEALVEHAMREGWKLDAERISCPVRIVWGTDDLLVPWPSAAVRFREDWLPNADWVVLDGVGHCPQLDVPLETAELILGFTS
jgi:pimeloyl-ACP methyl ester carboxylesterase